MVDSLTSLPECGNLYVIDYGFSLGSPFPPDILAIFKVLINHTHLLVQCCESMQPCLLSAFQAWFSLAEAAWGSGSWH